ncbi:MAG: glutamate synthase [Thermodesulfobacteriota bacterium]|nr:glutamate synthase [Thermodesulfobacteriota bacterium]
MCRLLAITSNDFVSPDLALCGLNVMKEGYDGSGLGIFLRDLGGPFAAMKDAPVLSGIFSAAGVKRLDRHLLNLGFMTKYRLSFKLPKTQPSGVPKRDIYLVRAYEYPIEWEDLSEDEKKQRLMNLQLELRRMGEKERDMIVFSFWPDTIMIKEIGDPMDIARYLDLGRDELAARVIMVQGRQNTNYEIDLYACHPFFLQGYTSMTNGENTAFIPNRDFLMSRGFPGYTGYMSDSEVFTHILHYTVERLGLDVAAYKHIITPLQTEDLDRHPDAALLRSLKQSCRRLIIDGPNCVIGCLPDNTVFMVQDRKKLRPGVVGHAKGTYVLASEICGMDAVIPDREKALDFQPMHTDTVIIPPDKSEMRVVRQQDPVQLLN